MAIDPYQNINRQELANTEYINEQNRLATERIESEEKETQADTQFEQTQQDPRENPEGWGLAGLAREGQSILSGGLQDTASSIATLPERTVDMFSGEMQEERKETGSYTPEWDPFVGEDGPIETKTWWGKLLRGVVHFGSLSLIPIAGWKAAAGKAAYYGTNSLLRAAAMDRMPLLCLEIIMVGWIHLSVQKILITL